MELSQKFRFADWPNDQVPAVAVGVYAIWQTDHLLYCGMSGRQIETIDLSNKKEYGLVTRLKSHQSGRLSSDQFCVYVANRIVIPQLKPDDLKNFETGELTLDRLTKSFIHENLEYQFAILTSSTGAFDAERQMRDGSFFGSRPFLNPLGL